MARCRASSLVTPVHKQRQAAAHGRERHSFGHLLGAERVACADDAEAMEHRLPKANASQQ